MNADEAVAVAEAIGFPVVIKARSGSLVHKSELGGVVLGLDSPDAVRAAYQQMATRLGPEMQGAVVQATATKGVEAIVGLAADPAYGPIVMVGLGGILTDLLGDRSFGVPPLERGEADLMIAGLRAAPLLEGYRNTPLVDRQALVEVVEAVALLAEEVPELVELDLNPVVVGADGALVLDCKVRLAPIGQGPGPLFRSLRRGTRH
jgi:acyl-CoA synthetase (NDP forming)